MSKLPAWMRTLLGLLAALLAVFLVTRIPKPAAKKDVPSFPESPVKLEIAGPASRVLLEKREKGWRMKEPVDFPADEEAVRAFVSSLSALSFGETLTQRPETHAQYQVDEASAVSVRAWAAGAQDPVALLFGKGAPDFTHVYVRVPGKNEVYLAQGLRRYELEKPVRDWRDRRIASWQADDAVVRLTVEKGRGAYVLQKDSDTWTLGGRAADKDKMDRLLSELRALSAEDFIDPPQSSDLKSYGLNTPALKVTVETASGKKIELRFGKKDAAQDRYPLQRDGEPVLFWVPAYVWAAFPATSQELIAAGS